MKNGKVYKGLPPKEPAPLPSDAEMLILEKSLREAAGGYYDERPAEKAPTNESWLRRTRPGIEKRLERWEAKLFPSINRKKGATR